jgi:hypothetical protein
VALTVMSGIAELERDSKRCQAGIERAKAKGTKFGRPSALDASQRRKIAERYAAGETMAELAREYECGDATIWRALHPSPFAESGGDRAGRKRDENGVISLHDARAQILQAFRRNPAPRLVATRFPFGGRQPFRGKRKRGRGIKRKR